MTDKVAPVELSTVTLQVVSPCEHGVHHEFLELPASTEDSQVWFATRKCVDSKGNPRPHLVTKEKYPQVRRRR